MAPPRWTRALGASPQTAVLVVAALALVGCGGDDEEAVEETVGALSVALVEGHGEAACELLSPAAREEVLAVTIASDPGAEIARCGSSVRKLGRGKREGTGTVAPLREAVESGDLVDSVSVERATAVATVARDGARLKVALERGPDGRWLVSDPKQLLFGEPEG